MKCLIISSEKNEAPWAVLAVLGPVLPVLPVLASAGAPVLAVLSTAGPVLAILPSTVQYCAAVLAVLAQYWPVLASTGKYGSTGCPAVHLSSSLPEQQAVQLSLVSFKPQKDNTYLETKVLVLMQK